MNIEDLTIKQAKELAQMFGGQNTSCVKPLVNKGDKIFTRTLTYHYIGEVVEDNIDYIVLNNCSWVADSGQFTSCIKEGKLDEVEIIGDDVKILKSNMTDCIPWVHELPKSRR